MKSKVPYLLVIALLATFATAQTSARQSENTACGRVETTGGFGSFTADEGRGFFGETAAPLTNSLNLLYGETACSDSGAGGKHNTDNGGQAVPHSKTIAGQHPDTSLIPAGMPSRGPSRLLHRIGRLNI